MIVAGVPAAVAIIKIFLAARGEISTFFLLLNSVDLLASWLSSTLLSLPVIISIAGSAIICLGPGLGTGSALYEQDGTIRIRRLKTKMTFLLLAIFGSFTYLIGGPSWELLFFMLTPVALAVMVSNDLRRFSRALAISSISLIDQYFAPRVPYSRLLRFRFFRSLLTAMDSVVLAREKSVRLVLFFVFLTISSGAMTIPNWLLTLPIERISIGSSETDVGYLVSVDDVSVTLLRLSDNRVRFVPTGEVTKRILCYVEPSNGPAFINRLFPPRAPAESCFSTDERQ